MTKKQLVKRRYRLAHMGAHRDENKRYREAHPDRVRKLKKRQYLENRAQTIARSKQWAARNAAKRSEIRKKWKRQHPLQAQIDFARRRARQAGVLNDLTASQWRNVLASFGNTCAYAWLGGCSTRHSITQDHLVPISRGGDHTLTNVVPACGSHNYSKVDKTALEYLLSRQP
jgi:5-methylcytosine-specific restriction endonuclease McrA